MAIGHFMMAFEPLFLFALGFLILGNGAFKPNISTQVGTLYPPGDARRDRAFSIFYVGINLGAFLAPLVCGTLGEKAGWHYGFAAAGVGMTIGLAIYLRAAPLLPPDALSRRTAADDARPFSRDEWRALGALVLLALPVTFFWATYEQVGNTVTLWADGHTDRSLGLLAFTIPTTWFLALNPLLIFAFTPLVLGYWKRQAAAGREPSTVAKMAYGCFGNAAAHLILVAAALHAGADKAGWLWLAAYVVVITVGELYLSPVSLSLVTKVAPARCLSMMMGVWLATSFTGGFLAGFLGSYWSAMDKDAFFLMIAIVAGCAGLVVLAFVRPLSPILRD
jgi:POT family proton-dependent oligopeptide transporter